MNISAVQNIKLEAIKNTELKRNNNIFAEPTEPQKDSVSFKAGVPSSAAGKGKGLFGKLGDKWRKFLTEKYGAKMYNSKGLYNASKKIAGWNAGDMTQHMATLGSLLTSSVYVMRTLKNKDLDEDKRNTLAINQAFCFVVPTICAYTVNSALGNLNKKIEYKYAGIQEQKKALGKLSEAQMKDLIKKQGTRLKGFRTLASLATFTLIYRYITPVAITPIANRIGEKINAKRKQKKIDEANSTQTVVAEKEKSSKNQPTEKPQTAKTA